MTLERRRFIQVLAGISCLAALMAKNPLKVITSNSDGKKMTDLERDYLAHCRKQWFAQEVVLPADYINKTNKTNGLIHSYQEIITKEFKSAQTVNIDGFILSKYEAAHLAELIMFSV